MSANRRTDDRVPFAEINPIHDDLKIVMEFAAEVCGTTPEKLCPLDMLAWRLRKNEKTAEGKRISILVGGEDLLFKAIDALSEEDAGSIAFVCAASSAAMCSKGWTPEKIAAVISMSGEMAKRLSEERRGAS